jgi:hypothetical protein
MSSAIASWRQRHRTHPCFNTTSETVPPFAIMQLRRPKNFKETVAATNTEQKNNFICQHMRGGQVVWDVTKPNAEGVSRQDPADFVFNGPVPIESLSYGECTDDYPCQVLHSGGDDRLLNGWSCGPAKDRWYVLSGGSAFTCKCHDLSYAAGTGQMHTVWIDRGTGRTIAVRGRFAVSATDLAASAYIPWGAATLNNELNPTDPWLKVQRDGLYLISFHGKLTSSDAARGDALSITLYKKEADEEDGTSHNPTATPYIVGRNQDIEQLDGGANQTPTAECVSFTGFESLGEGDGIALKNTCSKLLTLSGGVLTVFHVGNKIEDAVSDGGGFDATQS